MPIDNPPTFAKHAVTRQSRPRPRWTALGLLCGAALLQPAWAQVDAPPPPVAASGAAAGLSTPAAHETLPKQELTSEIFFEVVAAEIGLQRGLLGPAYNTYISLANDTKDPRMARRAVEIALSARQLGDALVAARLWHNLDPQWRPATQLLATLLVGTGKPDEAEPLLADELAKVPEARRGQAILELEQMLARGPQHDKEVDFLKRLLANDMQRPEAQLAMARAQIAAGDSTAARQSLEQALKIKPDYEAAALTLAQLGPAERKAAIAQLEDFLKRNPNSKEARFAYAKVLLADGRLDDAQKQFETLEKRYPHELSTLMALALLNLHAKHPDQAEQYLRKYADEATQQGADAAQAYVYLAQIAEDRKDYAQGDQWLTRVSEESALYIPAQIGRAQLLADQGKLTEARALLATVQTNDPREKLALKRGESDILVKGKRYGEAEKLLAGAVKAYPNDSDLLYQYGMVAELNHHYDLMEKTMRKLMVTQPNNPQAYNALGYSLTERNIRLPEALKLIEKASELAPDDPYIMDSLGWIKYRLGDKQAALALLRRAYGLQAQAEIGAHLGEVLWETGQHDEARKYWSDAYKLDSDDETLKATIKRYKFTP